jgi:hypothetical protein
MKRAALNESSSATLKTHGPVEIVLVAEAEPFRRFTEASAAGERDLRRAGRPFPQTVRQRRG